MNLEDLQRKFYWLINKYKNSDNTDLLERLDELEEYIKEAKYIDEFPDEYLDMKFEDCLTKAEEAIKAIKKIKNQTNDSRQLSLKF